VSSASSEQERKQEQRSPCEPARRLDGYERRQPEATALYQSVAQHWPSFAQRLEEQGGLAKFVREEFAAFLKCGLPEHGCLELCCRHCGHSMLVAFSCKRRGFCPGCLGRRMADTAAHLVQSVLPEVPVRHWVCSFPWGVRAVLGYDRQLCRAATQAFAKEVSRSLKRRAKQELGLHSVSDALTGLVAVVQRTDGALRLNVHLHCLGLDGVYVQGPDGALEFHALPTPSSAEVAGIARRTAQRLHQAFRKQGRSSPWDEEAAGTDGVETDSFREEQPGLFACYQAAAQGIAVSGERAGQPVLRVVVGGAGQPATHDKTGKSAEQPIAEALGVSVYAKQLVHGRDRPQLERLCRYLMRPPLSQERLALRDDGRLELTLKNVWKDGTRALVLEPHDLLVRLCATVPPPWFNMIRYFGVLSSHSRQRAQVCPQAQAAPGRFAPEPAAGEQLSLEALLSAAGSSVSSEQPEPRAGRSRWSWLLKRVFRADVDSCSRCGGPMRWLEVATEQHAIARLLSKQGLAPRPPPAPRLAVPVGQLSFPFGR